MRMASEECKLTLAGHLEAANSDRFSPDVLTVMTVSEDLAIKLWSAACGDGLDTLIGHEEPVQCGAFSLDGGPLVTGSLKGAVKVCGA